jgi:hypothetical protein
MRRREFEIRPVVVGRPVSQAPTGMPLFGRGNDPGLLAKGADAQERVGPLAAQVLLTDEK